MFIILLASVITLATALIDLGRMPRNTHPIVAAGKFADYVPNAPQADLNIFGVQKFVSTQHIRQMVVDTKALCIFVKDSGNESALA